VYNTLKRVITRLSFSRNWAVTFSWVTKCDL